MRVLLGFVTLVLASINPATILCLVACSALRPAEEPLPPECSDEALMHLEAAYVTEVLAACKGKDFETCPERQVIEDDHRALREEWAKCPARR